MTQVPAGSDGKLPVSGPGRPRPRDHRRIEVDPTDRLVDLDDPRALDPLTVGAKAARLAAARTAGLPALPGVVVPVGEARLAFARGLEALVGGGSGAARLAAMEAPVDAGLAKALAARVSLLGVPAVVRSSSPLESSGHWAGAFSSFDGIGIDDLATALRGCWASAFSVHALRCAEAAGLAPADVRLALLVQPELRFVWGGAARVLDDDSVEVIGTRGEPRLLLNGWDPGGRAVVDARGGLDGDGLLDEETVLQVAALARAVAERIGDDLIEWGRGDRDTVLLQARRQPPRVEPPAQSMPAALGSPLALRVALLAERFGGSLGEELVLPWAVGLEDLPPAANASVAADPEQTRVLAAQLTKAAWEGEDPTATLAGLRGTGPGPALDRLARVRPVDRTAAARLLALLGGVASRTGRGPDRWEPFVYDVLMAHGRRHSGVPASPGIAAGRLRLVADPRDPPTLGHREVLAAVRPVPALAPLLWNAAALVTTAGSPGAHLLEVANSLGLPAVVQADIELSVDGGIGLVAIDGNTGQVAVLPAADG